MQSISFKLHLSTVFRTHELKHNFHLSDTNTHELLEEMDNIQNDNNDINNIAIDRNLQEVMQ